MARSEDYIINLKLNSKNIDKEYKRKVDGMSKQLDKINKTAQKNERILSKEVSLLRSKERLEKSILKARRAGVTGLDQARGLLSSTSKAAMDKAQIEVAKKAATAEGRISKEKLRQAQAQKELLKSDAERYRMWQLKAEGDRRRQREAEKLARVSAKASDLRGASGGRFRHTQTGANIRQGLNTSLGGLDSISGPNLTESTAMQVGALRDKLRGLKGDLYSARTRGDVARLKTEYTKARIEANQLVNTQRKINSELSMGARVGNKFSRSLKRAGLKLASVYAVFEAGKAVFRIGKDMDSMRAGLMAASDSAEEANHNFSFLKDTAQSLGQDIQVGVRGFNRLAVAARGAGMSTEEAREIFSAASEASATFQLDAQRSNLVMLAFSQMMSKGKVSAEELNRQMSEQLPIAMQAAEMATGKTAGEIFKMMEQGKLLSKDFVLPFARAMRTLVRENDALATAQDKMAAHQARMNNSFKILMDKIFQGKAAKVIGNLFRRLQQVIEAITPAATLVVNSLFEIFDMAVEATSGIVGLQRAIADLITSGGMLSRGWSLTKAFFHGLASVIWEVIGAVQLLGETLRGETTLAELGSVGEGFMSRMTFGLSDKMAAIGQGQGGTTIAIDRVEVHNPMNMDDLMNEFSNLQGN